MAKRIPAPKTVPPDFGQAIAKFWMHFEIRHKRPNHCSTTVIHAGHAVGGTLPVCHTMTRDFKRVDRMHRLAGPFFICALALANTQANAQAGATPPPSASREEVRSARRGRAASRLFCVGASGRREWCACRFFCACQWQESRFNALAVSAKAAQGIAQFMPGTAGWRGLNNPFDVIAPLKGVSQLFR